MESDEDGAEASPASGGGGLTLRDYQLEVGSLFFLCTRLKKKSTFVSLFFSFFLGFSPAEEKSYDP